MKNGRNSLKERLLAILVSFLMLFQLMPGIVVVAEGDGTGLPTGENGWEEAKSDIRTGETFDTVTLFVDNEEKTQLVVDNGVLSNLPEDPQKEGHLFEEWNTEADGSGQKVTAGFAVTGDLNVYAIFSEIKVKQANHDYEIIVKGNSCTYAYDGSEQIVSGYTVSDYDSTINFIGIAQDDEKATARGTNTGTYTMTMSETDFSATSENYSNIKITVVPGTLEITPITDKITVTILGNKVTELYDGEPHKATGYQIIGIDNDLYTEDDFTFNGTAEAEGIDAESYPMGLTKDQFVNDNENFANVTFDVSDGVLAIEKRAVTLTSATDTKVFDGEPLTNDTITASDDGFAEGEGATYDVTGSQTLVGSSENAFTYTLNSNTKAENYDIATSFGTLSVTDRTEKYQIEVIANSLTNDYTGQPQTAEGFKTLTFTVNGQEYKVSGLSASVTKTDAGHYPNTITGKAKVSDAEGNDVTAQFTVILTDGELVINKRPVTISTGSDTKAYDGIALTNAEVSITGLAEGESVTLTATGSQTEVGSSENTYTIDWGKTKAGNYTVTESLGNLEVTANAAEVTLTAASGEKVYNGDALSNATVTASGLPAGFTVTATASGEQTDVGSSANTVQDSYVILNARGENRTGSFTNVKKVNGTLTVTPASVTISTGSSTKDYDGTALTNAEVTITGLVKDESVTLTATGSQTEVGSSANTYSIDWDKAKAKNYTVTDSLGTLTVTTNDDNHIILIAPSGTKEYDGQPLVVDGTGEAKVTASGLPAGFTVEATAYSFYDWADAGEGFNLVNDDYVIRNADGEDRTSNFTNVEFVPGTLTISPKPISISTSSASKPYNGKPLTSEKARVDGLVEGETVVIFGTGSQTEVGSSKNTYDLTWNDAKETNYSIANVDLGTLTVVPSGVQVVLTAASDRKTYDGTPLTNSTVTATGLPEGFTFTATATGSQLNAGESANVVDDGYAFFNANGEDETASFTSVAKVDGKLTVYREELTIVTGSDSKAYDGTVLTSAEISITGLVEGESITLTATGSQTEIGFSENTYTINWDNVLENNYTVTEKLGTLTVVENNTQITLTAASGEKVYDGTPLTDATVTASGLPESFKVEATATGSQLNVGESVNTVDTGWIIRNADGEDRTASFTNVTTEDGTLKVTKRSLILTSADDAKAFDGEPLTNSTVTVSGDGFAADEGANYDVTGSQTLVGSSGNAFTYTLNEGTLAANYDISTVFGTLIVTGDGTIIPEMTTETVEAPYTLGDKVPFTITVRNISDEAIEQVTIMDETGEITAGEGYTVLDAHTALITNLQPDATVTVTVLHEVTPDDILAGEYVNTATVRLPDGKETEFTGSTDRLEPVDAALSLTMTVTNEPEDGTSYGLGEEIAYVLTVTNEGNVPLNGVTVTDEWTGLTENVGTLQPGESVTLNTSWVVTEADIIDERVVNTAEAKADPVGDTEVEPAQASAEVPAAQHFTITVNYRIEGGGLISTLSETHEYGYAYDFASPTLEGYTADMENVSGILTEDTVVEVLYRAQTFTLTITYRYRDGSQAARTYTVTVAYGKNYNVVSPLISGYRASMLRVAGTMPARDVTVAVIYAPNEIVIDEPTTPLGLGGGSINVGESIE